MMTPEIYTSRVDRIYDRVLRERMVEYLTKLARVFTDAGYTVSGPHDLSCDDYEWYIAIEGNGLPEQVDASIEINESMQYEGSTDGLNVSLDIVAWGGRILGGLSPFNYTPQVWVPLTDLHGIVARMAMIEDADMTSAVALVDEYASE